MQRPRTGSYGSAQRPAHTCRHKRRSGSPSTANLRRSSSSSLVRTGSSSSLTHSGSSSNVKQSGSNSSLKRLCSRHRSGPVLQYRHADDADDHTLVSIISDFIIVVIVVWYSIVKSCLLWILPRRVRMKDISRDTILITGGGRGVGRNLAVEFAKHKPRQIVIWGRNMDTLKATAQVVKLKGVQCHPMVCDISSRQEVYRKANELKQRYGEVTILVNNAATVHGHVIVDSDEDAFEKTINTNFMSNFWTIKAFLPDMLRRDHGHIVAMNSMLGLTGLAGASDYCMSKFAMTGFMEALHLEIIEERKLNIQVTNIHPYKIDTGLFAGVHTRFRSWFPKLERDFVASEIVRAVLLNQTQVLLPWSMYLFFMLRCLLPIRATRVVERFFKTQTAMDNFYGRSLSPGTHGKRTSQQPTTTASGH